MQSKKDTQKRSTRRPRVGRPETDAGDSARFPIRAELERRGGEPVGSFAAADGDHRCFLAYVGEAALLYDLPPQGPALCLAWVGGALADARAEAEAVFADYAERAADENRSLCRAVRVDELARLRSPQKRAA